MKVAPNVTHFENGVFDVLFLSDQLLILTLNFNFTKSAAEIYIESPPKKKTTSTH